MNGRMESLRASRGGVSGNRHPWVEITQDKRSGTTKPLGVPTMALLGRRSVMPEDPKESSATRRQAAKDLKAAEALQITARDDLAKGRASVSRRRVAIERGRATLARRAKAGEPDQELTPIYTNFEAAEADLDAAEEKLSAAAARIEFAERRLNEARQKARSAGR